MEKTAFEMGFEKRSGEAGFAVGAFTGATLGNLLGMRHHFEKDRDAMATLRSSSKVDAKNAYKDVAHLIPDAALLTKSDLQGMLLSGKYNGEKLTETELRGVVRLINSVSGQNAAALHPQNRWTDLFVGDYPVFKDKKVVITADKVNKHVLAHEVGHIIDADEREKKNILLRAMYRLRPTLLRESAAWDKAPGDGHDKIREKTLATYKASLLTDIATIGGAGVGAALGAMI